VGLSPSAAAAVTGGNPFGAMMQAWKYSLPAFLVPFMFATSKLGANLLIIGASWPGFILATLNSSAALVFLSLGIVGYMGATLSLVERGLLIASAVVIALVPIETSLLGLAGFILGVLVIAQVLIRHRKSTGKGPSRG
jgi:TRAP-type uncharacterized transport system fused permease subunit